MPPKRKIDQIQQDETHPKRTKRKSKVQIDVDENVSLTGEFGLFWNKLETLLVLNSSSIVPSRKIIGFDMVIIGLYYICFASLVKRYFHVFF